MDNFNKPDNPDHVPSYMQPCACNGCDFLVDTRPRRSGAVPRFVLGHHRRKHVVINQVECACGCGQKCADRDEYNNPRKYVPGHGWRRTRPEAKRIVRVTIALSKEEAAYLKSISNGRQLGKVVREEALKGAN